MFTLSSISDPPSRCTAYAPDCKSSKNLVGCSLDLGRIGGQTLRINILYIYK